MESTLQRMRTFVLSRMWALPVLQQHHDISALESVPLGVLRRSAVNVHGKCIYDGAAYQNAAFSQKKLQNQSSKRPPRVQCSDTNASHTGTISGVRFGGGAPTSLRPHNVRQVRLHPLLLTDVRWNDYAHQVLYHEYLHCLGYVRHNAHFRSVERLWCSEIDGGIAIGERATCALTILPTPVTVTTPTTMTTLPPTPLVTTRGLIDGRSFTRHLTLLRANWLWVCGDESCESYFRRNGGAALMPRQRRSNGRFLCTACRHALLDERPDDVLPLISIK
jgi:hypothetical protein